MCPTSAVLARQHFSHKTHFAQTAIYFQDLSLPAISEAVLQSGSNAAQPLVQRLLACSGGTGGLLASLAASDDARAISAAWALRNLCAADDSARRDVLAALPTVAAALRNHRAAVALQAAWMLSHVSENAAYCDAITFSPALAATVALLRGRSDGCSRPAAVLLQRLARGSRGRCEAIAAAGALQPLVDMLAWCKEPATLLETVEALTSLVTCCGTAIGDSIIDAGVIPHVITVEKQQKDSSEAAAKAMAQAAVNLTGLLLIQCQPKAVRALVALLSHESDALVKEAAGGLRTMCALFETDVDHMVRCGVLPALFALLHDRRHSVEAAREAAKLLERLTARSAAARDAVAGNMPTLMRALVSLGRDASELPGSAPGAGCDGETLQAMLRARDHVASSRAGSMASLLTAEVMAEATVQLVFDDPSSAPLPPGVAALRSAMQNMVQRAGEDLRGLFLNAGPTRSGGSGSSSAAGASAAGASASQPAAASASPSSNVGAAGSVSGTSSSSAASDARRCAACGKSAREAGVDKVRVCAGCRSVYYCGVDCQRADRRAHKVACQVRASER